MNDILYPSETRRFMTEAAGRRCYHRSAERALAAARGGVLWVAMGNGWTCQAERVARFVAACGGTTTSAGPLCAARG